MVFIILNKPYIKDRYSLGKYKGFIKYWISYLSKHNISRTVHKLRVIIDPNQSQLGMRFQRRSKHIEIR